MSKAIEPNDWEKFLTEFSERNKERRARFYIFFASGETLEEEEEGRFNGAVLSKSGNGKTRVVVKRGTTSGETMTDPIENVRGVAVQYETDGSENILEITDEKNTLFSLRFESTLDGDS